MTPLTQAQTDKFLDFLKFPSWCGSKVGPTDSAALCQMIYNIKPKNSVEIGVNTGCSTAVISWAMREIHGADWKNTEFHAFDIQEFCTAVRDRPVPVGQAVQEMDAELGKKVAIHPMETALDAPKYFKPNTVDFAFIDASHNHPWATLDLAALLPILRPGAWVALHDIVLSERYEGKKRNGSVRGPSVLFKTWRGEKIDGATLDPPAPNMGFLLIPQDKLEAQDWIVCSLHEAWDTAPPLEVLTQLKLRSHHCGLHEGYMTSLLESLAGKRGLIRNSSRNLEEKIAELPYRLSITRRIIRAIRNASRKFRGKN